MNNWIRYILLGLFFVYMAYVALLPSTPVMSSYVNTASSTKESFKTPDFFQTFSENQPPESYKKPAKPLSIRPVLHKTITKSKISTSSQNRTVISPVIEEAPSTTPQSELLPPPPPENTDFEAINKVSRPAVVNIICTTKSAGELSPITATGVFIDPRGIILTNAHVGQYWLLQNFITQNFVDCVIRTGSPAYPRYTAELVYISPTWIKNNKALLTELNPQGTGENDFALLRITGGIGGTPVPTSFPFISPSERENIQPEEQALLVSYPAGFLGGMSILQDLNVTSAVATIKEVFTFKTTTVDLISVPNTVVSQKGASGGAVVDKDKKLIGVISTSSDGNTTKERDLRAITIAHISRTLQDEVGLSLTNFLSQDLAVFAQKFQADTAPLLSKTIETELVK